MSELYKSIILRVSPEKFREHKQAKGEREWNDYFEADKVRREK